MRKWFEANIIKPNLSEFEFISFRQECMKNAFQQKSICDILPNIGKKLGIQIARQINLDFQMPHTCKNGC